MNPSDGGRAGPEVTLWLDPVCPFSWNTARWLRAVAEKTGVVVDWQRMSLAVLNEGRELPPHQEARMRDSQRVGRLMAAIARERGVAGWTAAYFAFGERYFDRSEPLDEGLIGHLLSAAGARETTAGVIAEASLDEPVRSAHQAAQDALGETGGSPIIRIDGHAFFGPVLTAPPEAQATVALFDAVATLAAIPQFAQLQRPRSVV
ncbi:DsbA family protein [Mycobacterium sp. E1747]|uniref:mycothiol-dependent nitroreductase Rv2466c family protein n=1 Tax=Mycobacterium sp. E1747 TaxID=1834128 RepID=UPI0007FCBE57|nr:DsbA family protein [Mycobacterium sp. E1747]OBH12223.1 hypothetical protein A5695_17580 [Mycobacterium sp. E1747]